MQKQNQQTTPTSSKFNIKQYERPGFTEDEIRDLKEAFDIFDQDKTGQIDHKELQTALSSLGFDANKDLINKLISDAQKDGDELINFDEFLDLMTVKKTDIQNRGTLLDMFELFNPKEGFITLDHLRSICRDVGEIIDDSELQEMMKRADFDKDERVNFEDFYSIITYKSKVQ